jgi:hypothetical protein
MVSWRFPNCGTDRILLRPFQVPVDLRRVAARDGKISWRAEGTAFLGTSIASIA